ncbi:hypothetical protein Tco_0520652 [Tanacetum coccineum]
MIPLLLLSFDNQTSQSKDKDKAGIEEALEALEEGMIIKTQFGVRLEGNMEEEAEQGSITDSNDFEVIV